MTLDYWKDCIAEAAIECDLTLTDEQLDALAYAAEISHENYGMAFYQPPASDRISDIEQEWKRKLQAQQDEHEQALQRLQERTTDTLWSRERQIYRLQEQVRELAER